MKTLPDYYERPKIMLFERPNALEEMEITHQNPNGFQEAVEEIDNLKFTTQCLRGAERM